MLAEPDELLPGSLPHLDPILALCRYLHGEPVPVNPNGVEDVEPPHPRRPGHHVYLRVLGQRARVPRLSRWVWGRGVHHKIPFFVGIWSEFEIIFDSPYPPDFFLKEGVPARRL